MPAMDMYNRELAETVNKMFSEGKNDPRAEEIADYHFGGKAVGGEIIDGIRKRLPTINRVIEQDYEHQACVVSEKYYTLFRNRQTSLFEMTDAEAQKCLPIGHGNRAAGIRLCTESTDVLYQAAVAQGLATGTGLIVAGVGRAKKAAEQGHIPEERGARLAENLRDKVSVIPQPNEMRQLAHQGATRSKRRKK